MPLMYQWVGIIVSICISYFSIAITDTMTKVTSRREGLFGASCSRGIGVQHCHGREHGRRQAGKAME